MGKVVEAGNGCVQLRARLTDATILYHVLNDLPRQPQRLAAGVYDRVHSRRRISSALAAAVALSDEKRARPLFARCLRVRLLCRSVRGAVTRTTLSDLLTN